MNVKSLIVSLVCAVVVAISANYGITAEKSVEVPPVQTPAVDADAFAADKVDINQADAALLTTLPGIGPKTAEKIAAYRQANGPFTSVDDLLNIKGIGPEKLEKIRMLVTIS